ncbi:E3 SUMO-protein ligase MMS21 isoform X2 [Arachis hypogaea]|nr:E3 SUMO-protein ligase MMS21 isoform X2 [Arachis hypogaea]
MKEIAVEFEKHNESDKVKELEDAVLELADLSEDSVHLSSAVQAIANRYQPKEEVVNNFRKLLEDEVSKLKGQSTTSDPNSNPLVRQFKEAVWKVHHEGQPMPGEEQEDIVMTSTQSSILNITCPLTGKPVTELEEPVRSVECKHIYEKRIIMQYIKSSNRCPISGCPKKLRADRVVQDALLLIEIEELRKMNKETEVEDFTLLNEDD